MRWIRIMLALATLQATYGVEDGRLAFDVDCVWGRLWATVEIGAEGIVVEEWGT